MTWLELSLKEWRRRPLRTAITAAGVAIATGALYSLLSFAVSYRRGMERELARLGAHVLVAPKGCPYDAASLALHGASWPCYLKQSYLEEIRAVPGVLSAAPAFMTAIYSRDGVATVYLGIEETMLALKPGWRLNGRFPRQEDEVLIGAETARRNQWRIGQFIRLPELNGRVATVCGVLGQTQGTEDSFIYLPLAFAQQLFHHTNELTHVLVRLNDPNQLEDVVRQLRGCDAGLSMNVIPLAHVFRTINSVINSARAFLLSIVLIAVALAGAGLSNALLISVSERTGEIGTLRALGASAGDIFRLVWLETLLVCTVGSGGGIILAFSTARQIESWARAQLPFTPTDTLLAWEWPLALVCLGSALALGSAAGLAAAWRAARIPPIQAMRSLAR